MPPRLSPLAFALLLCASAPAAALPVRLVVTGSVTEPGGRPVSGARLSWEGAPGATAVADAEGRYLLSHDVPEAAAETPLRLVLRARHRGWNLALPSGSPSLALELRRVARGDSAWLEVRANDAATAREVARALGAGEGVVALEARFTRLGGREDRSPPVLSALEVVPLAAPAVTPSPVAAAPAETPVPAAPPERPESMRLFPRMPETAPPASDTARGPRPPEAAPPALAAPPGPDTAGPATVAAPPASAPPAVVPAFAAAPDTALRPGIRVSVRPDTASPASLDTAAAPAPSPLRVALGRAVPGPAAAADGCGCRVSGTVEVRSERPLRGRQRVEVAVAGLPGTLDTVTLFMGPPRAFDLGRVPCGRHELRVRPLGGRLRRVEPDSTAFECVGGARQFRVVLEPR